MGDYRNESYIQPLCYNRTISPDGSETDDEKVTKSDFRKQFDKNKYMKKWREKNKQKVMEYNKQYREKKKSEKILETGKQTLIDKVLLDKKIEKEINRIDIELKVLKLEVERIKKIELKIIKLNERKMYCEKLLED